MKEKILRATAKLIARNGVHSTSTREICAELGITAPTLYYHFADKAQLLESTMSHSFERHLAKIDLASAGPDPVEALRARWDAYMQFVIEEPELYAIMINSILKGQIPEAGRRCLADLVARFKAPGLADRLVHDAETSAHIFLAAAQGVAVMSMARPEKKIHAKTRDTVLSALVSNFKKLGER